MKSKQLANVLIKMLGLSICLHAIPGTISGILYAISQSMKQNSTNGTMWIVTEGISGVIQIVVGLAIIAASQKVSSWMFSEDE